MLTGYSIAWSTNINHPYAFYQVMAFIFLFLFFLCSQENKAGRSPNFYDDMQQYYHIVLGI